MKRLIALLLAVCLCAGLLAGCGGNAPAETDSSLAAAQEAMTLEELKQQTAELTLYTYYVDSDKEIVDYALNEMKKIFPNVTVIPENRTDADGTVLKTRAAVGELPDIFECPSNVLESFATSGDILPLDEAMEEMGFADYVYPTVLENRANSDGKIYTISALSNEPMVFYYNKAVFAQYGLSEPKNYEELKSVVSTLAENGVIPLALFGQEKWPGLQLYDLACLAGGSQGIQALETGEEKITDDAFVNAANMLAELTQMGLVGKGAFSTNSSQAFEQFRLGQAGMLVNGVWYFGDALEYGEDVGYFTHNPFAAAGQEEEARKHLSGGQMSPGGYAVSATSDNARLATMYMLYFNIERAKAKTILYGAVSALTEDVQPQEPRYESYQQFADSVGEVESYSKYEWSLENAEVKTALEDSVEMLLAGSYSPEDFISSLDQQITAALG